MEASVQRADAIFSRGVGGDGHGRNFATPLWFALRFGPTTFAIFDAFHDEAGRQAHLAGPIAAALMANAPTLLASPPAIERLDVLGVKISAELTKGDK